MEECTSIGCSAKFLRGLWNFSLYKFSDFLEKRFCHCSLSCQFFLMACSLTSCCNSVLMASAKKWKIALLSGALLSFCVVCEIFLCTSFQTFLRRDSVTALYLVSCFCHQAICIHSLLHPQPNIFIWKMLGHIWCADTNDLLRQKFPTEDPAVCALLLPPLWESGNECVGFSLHKWKVLPSPKF